MRMSSSGWITPFNCTTNTPFTVSPVNRGEMWHLVQVCDLGREGSCVSNTWIVRVRVSPVFHLLKLQANAGGIYAGQTRRGLWEIHCEWVRDGWMNRHFRKTVNISGGSFFRVWSPLEKLWTRLIWWPLKRSGESGTTNYFIKSWSIIFLSDFRLST